MGKVPALVTSAWKGRAMKGRTLWIAMVLAGLCLLAPGAAVADEGQATASFWMELLNWLAAFVEETPAPPDAFGGGAPGNLSEAGILIPPSG